MTTLSNDNTQHNDTQHNDTQHNDTQHNGSQHNDTQHNDIQFEGSNPASACTETKQRKVDIFNNIGV